MDLTSPKIIKELLAKHGAAPSKLMGQNFLVNKPSLDKIIEASQLSKSDVVLEIGPGIGTLTQALARGAKKVIAVEKDATMVEILKETLEGYHNVELINEDALKFSIINFQLSTYKVVANLPYYITSPVIRMFLESKNPPEAMVLMVQKEVAQRICAKPPNMSILAVSVQFYAKTEIISYVKKECFWPSPKVDSAIIAIRPRDYAEINAQKLKNTDSTKTKALVFVEYSKLFFGVVKAGFSHPRKQLLNNLSVSLKKNREEVAAWLLKNGIQPQQRAETLSLANWQDLANSIEQIANGTERIANS